jgi:fucose 4-O-acetylase-like acetyltransferase
MASSTSPATKPTTKPPRDPWFDNIKVTLVTLVVVGHSWPMLPKTRLNMWLYDFLYAWHIPAFVLITGYLSRSFTYAPKRLWSLVRTVAVPYFIFEGLLAWYRIEVGGEHLHRIFLNPHWPTWYLAALILWRLMTPIFRLLPMAVLVAAVISVVSGMWVTDVLDNSRAFGFLPFFVVGLTMRPEHWALLRSRRAVYVGFGALLVIFGLARYTRHWISKEWLYYRTPYDQLDSSTSHAMVVRSVLLVIGLCGALAVLTLIPRGRSWFTVLGAATIVVYLYHGFFVLTAKYHDYPGWAHQHPTVSLPLTTAAAVALALLLALPWVAGPLSVLTDPIGAAGRVRRFWKARRPDASSRDRGLEQRPAPEDRAVG